MKIIIPIVMLLLIVTSAFADDCDKPRDDFDNLYCLNKIYIESDKELNIAYKELQAFLTKEERNQLKKTQLTWIENRNSNCSFRKDGRFFVSLSCTADTTIKRTNILKDRIRECKATGCQASKLKI